MPTSKGTCLSTAVAAILAAAVALPAMAQTTEMEEIIVTARKRDESFQDVPVTVNVFTEALVKDAGIYRPADFIQMVPNMTLVETQNAGNAFVVIRGISQARNSEPSVAVQVDGVLQTNPAEFNQELYDIQQIEVLKGPQGALYGRNAIGGAIIITTQDPADEFEATVKAGYGNENSIRGQLGVSGPLGDSAGYRAHGQLLRDRRLPAQRVPERDRWTRSRDLSARARFVCEPSDNFTRRLPRCGGRPVHAGALLRRAARRRGQSVRRLRRRRQRRGRADPARQPGHQRPRRAEHLAEARFRRRRRDPYVGDALQHDRGDPDRRCVRLPAGRELAVQRDLRLRPQPEPVPRRRGLQPGAPLHVADRGQVPLDRGRLLHPHRPVHLDRQHGGHRRGRVPGLPRAALRRQQPERDLPRRLAGQRRLGRVRERDHANSARRPSSTSRSATTRTRARIRPRRPRLSCRSARRPAPAARCARTPGANRSRS